MRKNILYILLITAAVIGFAFVIAPDSKTDDMKEKKEIFDIAVTTIDGDSITMEDFKGKKLMIVNVASKCGYTKQYEGLQKLYEKYGGEEFEIIGFPANNFMNQEPGTNEEIKEFCSLNYNVTFPMMAKISVKGKDKHPLYQWLTTKTLNGVADSKVKWNFQKYFVDASGNLVGMLSTQTKPDDKKIIDWLEQDIAPGF